MPWKKVSKVEKPGRCKGCGVQDINHVILTILSPYTRLCPFCLGLKRHEISPETLAHLDAQRRAV